jgi:hypothetical protein
MKTYQVELKNYSRRADRSVTFKVDSLLEIKSKEISEIDSNIGNIGLLVLTDQHTVDDIDIDDILKNMSENDLVDNRKTPAQRLRGALYLRLEQKLGRKPEKTEFATYYLNNMNAIISKITDELD